MFRQASHGLALLGAVAVLTLAGCGGWGRTYLDNAVGKASEQDVRAELGAPDRIVLKDAGQSVWIYRKCSLPASCHLWYLTFDHHHQLHTWERAPEQL